jgi:hypothetical protein
MRQRQSWDKADSTPVTHFTAGEIQAGAANCAGHHIRFDGATHSMDEPVAETYPWFTAGPYEKEMHDE